MFASATASSCSNCSSDINALRNYCPHCGAQLGTSVTACGFSSNVFVIPVESASTKIVRRTSKSLAIERSNKSPRYVDNWNFWPKEDYAKHPKNVPEATIEPRQPPDELGLTSNPVRAPPPSGHHPHALGLCASSPSAHARACIAP